MARRSERNGGSGRNGESATVPTTDKRTATGGASAIPTGGALLALGLVVAGYAFAPELGRVVAALVRRPRRPAAPPVDLAAKYPGAIDV